MNAFIVRVHCSSIIKCVFWTWTSGHIDQQIQWQWEHGLGAAMCEYVPSLQHEVCIRAHSAIFHFCAHSAIFLVEDLFLLLLLIKLTLKLVIKHIWAYYYQTMSKARCHLKFTHITKSTTNFFFFLSFVEYFHADAIENAKLPLKFISNLSERRLQGKLIIIHICTYVLTIWMHQQAIDIFAAVKEIRKQWDRFRWFHHHLFCFIFWITFKN